MGLRQRFWEAIFFSVLLFFSCGTTQAAGDFQVPKHWLFGSEECNPDDPEDICSAEEKPLLRGIGKIGDATFNLLETMEPRRDLSSQWGLSHIRTYLGVEPRGTLGLLGLRGVAGLELFWVPHKSPAPSPPSQPSRQTPARSSAAPLYSLDLARLPTSGENDDIHALVRSLKWAHPDVDEKQVVQELMSKGSYLKQSLEELFSDTNSHSTVWQPKRVWVDVGVGGSVTSGLVAGGSQFTVRLFYKRMKEKSHGRAVTSPQADLRPRSENAFVHTVKQLATDLEVLSKERIPETSYHLKTIQVGLGLSGAGRVLVGNVRSDMLVTVFFDKLPPTVPNLRTPQAAAHPVFRPQGDESARDAYLHFQHEEPSKVVLLNRKVFQKGLAHSEKMAQKVILSLDRPYRSRKWDLQTVGTRHEILPSGSLGLVTLTGRVFLELYFERQNG